MHRTTSKSQNKNHTLLKRNWRLLQHSETPANVSRDNSIPESTLHGRIKDEQHWISMV